jgi:hypothetical protein
MSTIEATLVREIRGDFPAATPPLSVQTTPSRLTCKAFAAEGSVDGGHGVKLRGCAGAGQVGDPTRKSASRSSERRPVILSTLLEEVVVLSAERC